MRKTAHRHELFICQVLLAKTTLTKNGLKSLPPDYHAVHFQLQSDSITIKHILNI